MEPLMDDAVLHMGRSGRRDDLDRLELRVADVLQQPLPGPQDDRHDMEVELVEEASREVLIDRAGTASDLDVLVAGGRAGLLER